MTWFHLTEHGSRRSKICNTSPRTQNKQKEERTMSSVQSTIFNIDIFPKIKVWANKMQRFTVQKRFEMSVLHVVQCSIGEIYCSKLTRYCKWCNMATLSRITYPQLFHELNILPVLFVGLAGFIPIGAVNYIPGCFGKFVPNTLSSTWNKKYHSCKMTFKRLYFFRE